MNVAWFSSGCRKKKSFANTKFWKDFNWKKAIELVLNQWKLQWVRAEPDIKKQKQKAAIVNDQRHYHDKDSVVWC